MIVEIIDDDVLSTKEILKRAFPKNDGLEKIFIRSKELRLLNKISKERLQTREYYCVPYQESNLDTLMVERFYFPKEQHSSSGHILVQSKDIAEAYNSLEDKNILGWTHSHPGCLGAFHSGTDIKNSKDVLAGLDGHNKIIAYRNIPLTRWVTSPDDERNNTEYPNLMIRNNLISNSEILTAEILNHTSLLERYRIINYAISIVVATNQISTDGKYPFARLLLAESDLDKAGNMSMPRIMNGDHFLRTYLVPVDEDEPDYDDESISRLVDDIKFYP